MCDDAGGERDADVLVRARFGRQRDQHGIGEQTGPMCTPPSVEPTTSDDSTPARVRPRDRAPPSRRAPPPAPPAAAPDDRPLARAPRGERAPRFPLRRSRLDPLEPIASIAEPPGRAVNHGELLTGDRARRCPQAQRRRPSAASQCSSPSTMPVTSSVEPSSTAASSACQAASASTRGDGSDDQPRRVEGGGEPVLADRAHRHVEVVLQDPHGALRGLGREDRAENICECGTTTRRPPAGALEGVRVCAEERRSPDERRELRPRGAVGAEEADAGLVVARHETFVFQSHCTEPAPPAPMASTSLRSSRSRASSSVRHGVPSARS